MAKGADFTRLKQAAVLDGVCIDTNILNISWSIWFRVFVMKWSWFDLSYFNPQFPI